MKRAHVTKAYSFNAGHRLFHPERDADWNWETFGKCSYEEGHGHNYVLEVTVEGEIDEASGFVAPMARIDAAVEAEVMRELDHRNLNRRLELRYGPTPTTEVLILELWDRLAPWFDGPARLYRLRVFETEKNAFEYFGPEVIG